MKFFEIIILKFFNKVIMYYWNLQYNNFKMKFNIASNFRFNGKGILFYGDGEIILGNNSYIGELSTIQAYKGFKVIIGENTMISHNVRIYTQTLESDQDFSIAELIQKNGDVLIGNHVWIGANVFINPGVTIGDNSIIGANSVVTNNVKPFTVVGGVPARIIKLKKLVKKHL